MEGEEKRWGKFEGESQDIISEEHYSGSGHRNYFKKLFIKVGI
jgi:hypothetical protein